MPSARVGRLKTAAIGTLRRATRPIATPTQESMTSHPGVLRPPFSPTHTISARKAQCAGSWNEGDCHSWILARPQSESST